MVSLSPPPAAPEDPLSSGSPDAHPYRANAAPTATAVNASRPLFLTVFMIFSLLVLPGSREVSGGISAAAGRAGLGESGGGVRSLLRADGAALPP